MANWLKLQDDKLPTWAHTTGVLVIVAVFALPLLWLGAKAIVSGHLDAVSGPELGGYFFGPKPLNGRAAVMGGFALVVLGVAFVSLGLAYSRMAANRIALRWLPWVLLAAYVPLSIWVRSLA
ncbi:MAG: hypothetical protein FJ145_05825 [Deltaproteobacteria bacterium]|nr:hypothetical protein [Deltaproteobacteria bacterium]